MKIVMTKARENFKAGDELDASTLEPKELTALLDSGMAVTATEWAAQNQVKAAQDKVLASNKQRIEGCITAAIKREAIAPKDEAVKAKAFERLNAGVDCDIICELIDTIPGKVTASLTTRQTKGGEGEVKDGDKVTVKASLGEAAKAYVTASEPMNGLMRSGRYDECFHASLERSQILKANFGKIMATDGDFVLKDVIRAAGYDTTDPDSQLGTLATGLVIQQNLGFLVKKLAWIHSLTTDFSAMPVRFGSSILTRYITPPNVLTYVPGTGYTSDSTAISNSSTGTTQSDGTTYAGTRTSSVPSTTDVPVKLDMHKGVELEFPVTKLALTARNLVTEQQAAQTYSLALAINQFVLGKLFAGTWTGAKSSYTKALNDWDMKGMIDLKNALTINQTPDVGRFALLHSFYHDKLLGDTNLLSAKAILALINKDESSFESGELPSLFGVKPLESQLASATSAGVLTTWVDPTSPSTTNIVGFAGDASSMVFVSRVPQDYNALANAMGVPATAAVEIVTEPDSGLSMLIVRYVDNGKASIVVRAALMYGAAQGDPRKGVIIKLA